MQSIRVTGYNTIIWNTGAEGRLTVYDISGREMIKEESNIAGNHKTNIRDLKNGIYFIKLETNTQIVTEMHVIIR